MEKEGEESRGGGKSGKRECRKAIVLGKERSLSTSSTRSMEEFVKRKRKMEETEEGGKKEEIFKRSRKTIRFAGREREYR